MTTIRPEGDLAGTPTVPPGGEGSQLAYRAPDGSRRSILVRFGPDRPMNGRPGFRSRTVFPVDRDPFVQHRLVAATREANGREDLERECGSALRLTRAYGPSPHRPLFTHVRGYDFDVIEPFVLYERPRGSTLEGAAGRLDHRDRHLVLEDCVRAVRLLQAVGLVHRGLAPDTVRWDGESVQLGPAYLAEQVGRPRRPVGSAPWASPEQREGAGVTDPRDDLWSVAQVAHRVFSRRDADADGSGDLRRPAGLPAAVTDVLAESAARRPTPLALLERLGASDPLRAMRPETDPLGEARREFDAVLARKRAPAAAPAPADEPDIADEVRGFRWPTRRKGRL